ncbi:PAS domain S-box protein [Chlorogloeopsis sp. ULAP01]|uniref:PAS domain S-box protein n=1 Tax=Chlorogloeopsis sp. ULAP01 TaxID=3056483 RepID=UPI0025AAE896|nr:PAS domain S-box protein [Chlorogloeopsis sp. ULAP01]MDM9381219.1 PAS domain S-box protein [Chlorogloeopsis sp. ULAP01]
MASLHNNCKQAEETSPDKQIPIKQLADMSPGLLYLYDVIEHRNLYINARSLELLGYSPETVLAMGGDFMLKVMHPDDLAQMPAHLERLNASCDGSFHDIQYRMQHTNGEWHWFRSRDTVFKRTADGRVCQVLGTAEDITEQIRAETALREKEQHLNIALQTAKLGTWQLDLASSQLTCSQQCKANFGLPSEIDFSYQTLFSALHPDDRDRAQVAMQQAIEQRSDYDIELRCCWADGSLHWLIARGRLIYGSDGTPVRMVGVTLDITERKQYEESLKAANQRISNILESNTDAFVAFDRQWRYTYVNREASRILQRSPEELLGKCRQDIFLEADRLNPQIYQELYRAVAEQVTVKFESFSFAANCWLEISAFPFSDGLAVYFRDISDHKREERRKAARYAVTCVLAEATTLVDAVPAILQSLCENLNWQLGSIWSVDKHHNILRYVNSWHAAKTNLQEFITVNQQTTFAPGIGLPGMIWANRQPAWIAKINKEKNFTRSASASKSGLQSVFGFPILLGSEILGVIECFSDRAQEPDEDLLQMMAAIGSQIGQFMERIRTREALKESQALFQSFMNNSPIAAFIKDEAGKYIYVNAFVEQLLQRSQSELVGKTDFELVPDQATQMRANDAAVLTTNQAIQVLETLQTQDGEHYYMSFKFPFQNTAGRKFLAGMSVEISDRIRAEAALRKSEEKYRTIFENAGVSIWEEDFSEVKAAIEQLKTQGIKDFRAFFTEHPEFVQQAVGMVRLVNINHTTVRMFGAQDKNELLTSFKQIFLPETFEVFVEKLLTIAEGKTSFESETIVKTLQGERLNVIFTVTFPPATATFDSVLASVMNITDRKRLEEALRESEERLRLALNAARMVAWTWNANTDAIIHSETACEVLGLTPDTLYGTGTQAWQLVHPEDLATHQATVQAAIDSKGSYVSEFRVIRPDDGKVIWVEDRGKITCDQMGNLVSIEGALFDITIRKQIEKRERAAREQAEATNRIKDEFLAVLSHELRSPLNPILGWTQLLQTRQFDQQATSRALEAIERNAKLQTQLIEDLLDVSRILRGKIVLNVCPVDLVAVIEAALETVHLAAEAKNITIQKVFATDIGQVCGDANRLQQVVWNLLSNAIKFTPPGGRVEVRLSSLKDTETRGHENTGNCSVFASSQYPIPAPQSSINNYALIHVMDTGKGICQEFLPHVFEYFRQEDGTTTRQFGGLGLGLAIARHITELHGGTIEAKSPGEGLGATFTVRLPLPANNPEVTQNRTQFIDNSDLSHLQILVVDDEADMRELLVTILEFYGAKVTVAASAAQALSTLEQYQPDLVISDIGMPDMDGYVLMQQIKSRSTQQVRKIPAIALTAYAGEYNRRQALAVGFELHISKPVEPQKLVSAIAQVMNKTHCAS